MLLSRIPRISHLVSRVILECRYLTNTGNSNRKPKNSLDKDNDEYDSLQSLADYLNLNVDYSTGNSRTSKPAQKQLTNSNSEQKSTTPHIYASLVNIESPKKELNREEESHKFAQDILNSRSEHHAQLFSRFKRTQQLNKNQKYSNKPTSLP